MSSNINLARGNSFYRAGTHVSVCLTMVLACALSGCGDKTANTDESAAKSAEPNAVSRSLSSDIAATGKAIPNRRNRTRKDVVGVWLGTATLDQAALQGKIEKLAHEQRQVVVDKARSFLSTTMAIDYKSDGSLENELEIFSTDGQLLRDGSTGTWKVLNTSEDEVEIETMEIHADGSSSKTKTTYRFSNDGSELVLSVPVSAELEACDAKLIFKRHTLPPVNVADAETTHQQK